jgi:hypothetical protein
VPLDPASPFFGSMTHPKGFQAFRDTVLSEPSQAKAPKGVKTGSVSLPTHTCAARTATVQTSRRFLLPTRKDSFIQLPALDFVLSRLAAVAQICSLERRPLVAFISPFCRRS